MRETSRREVMKGVVVSGLAGGGLAGFAQPVAADYASVGCDADSKHGVTAVGDSGNDGSAYVNSSGGTSNQHRYDIAAEADIYDDPDCCKKMKTTTTLYQERKDCYDGSTYWHEVDDVSETQQCEGDDANSDYGYVDISGSGWIATGDYRLNVESTLSPSSNDCDYDWDPNTEECNNYFTISDTDHCFSY